MANGFLPINTGMAYGNQLMNPSLQQSPIGSQGMVSPTSSTTPTNPMANWNWFGNEQSAGILPTAISGLGALSQGWLGFQQLNLAKDQLAFQKDAFRRNLANQTQLTNQQLVNQQQVRSSFDPANYQAVSEEWKRANLLPTA